MSPEQLTIICCTSGKMSVDSKPNNWESLRKQARALENEVRILRFQDSIFIICTCAQIDLKLVTFSKLGTNLSRQPLKEDKEPLLGGQTQEVEGVQADLESLLQQLGQVA